MNTNLRIWYLITIKLHFAFDVSLSQLGPFILKYHNILYLKRNSTLFINNEKLCPSKFAWQEGYGAFSYSQSHIKNVYQYIQNQ